MTQPESPVVEGPATVGPSEPGALPPPSFRASTPVVPVVDQPYARNAVNLSVFGFFVGRLRLTYERLLARKHGVFAEGILSPDILNGGDFVGYGAALGYRFHWRGPATSGFVGASVAVEHGSGSMVLQQFGKEEKHYFYGKASSVSLTPHVGKRWVFNHGVNLTFRIGVGARIPFVDADLKSDDKAVDLVKGSVLNVEGELSVGYTF